MKSKVWPKLDLESLTERERHAIQTVCAFIIELESEPSALARSEMKHPPEMFILNEVIRRDLHNKASSDPLEFMVQMGLSYTEIAIAFIEHDERQS